MMKHAAVLACGLVAAAVLGAGGANADARDYPRERIANAYIRALLTHDASDVPFAPDCTRVEAGIQTGYSGPQLTDDLNHGVQYLVIQNIRDVTFATDGDVVTTDYLLDAGIVVRLTTVRIHETFLIRDGRIHRIAADIKPVAPGS